MQEVYIHSEGYTYPLLAGVAQPGVDLTQLIMQDSPPLIMQDPAHIIMQDTPPLIMQAPAHGIMQDHHINYAESPH
jgi:hypothetical protein